MLHHTVTRIGLALSLLLSLFPGTGFGNEADQEPVAADPDVDIILLTLDTTRADAIGVFGGEAKTPNINALASRGIVYTRAISPSPLTLPAHASLLTGLEPPEHGARDNGRTVVDPTVNTIAEVLSAHGYSTAAFVSSRVLDHRFGLGRGFLHYDDTMVAEHLGEYGYAERDASAVTDAAIAWLESSGGASPLFLWVHYYDPHSPYDPPGQWRGETDAQNYAGEISFVDDEIGRLLDALPGTNTNRVVAVVGDHGESLGEHGERSHGIFLYGATVHVPLIVAGPGLAAGVRISTPVSTRRLAPTLVALAGVALPDFGAPLPTSTEQSQTQGESEVFSETLMPANAYGWSPLSALTVDRWRYIDAPTAELYDLKADPKELNNLAEEEAERAAKLKSTLFEYRSGLHTDGSAAADLDEDLIAALEALGYVTQGATTANDAIDPKEGIVILEDLEKAKQMIHDGDGAKALATLQRLHEKNPSNIPILTYLGNTQLKAGKKNEAIETYRKALSLNPGSEFLRLNLSRALARIGRITEARAEARRALEIDPRSSTTWLHLADLADNRAQEIEILNEARAAEVNSALILVRLADIDSKRGRRDAADRYLAEACRLAPGLSEPWLDWARNAELLGKPREAAERYRRALALEPENSSALLRLGIVLLQLNDLEGARHALTRAAGFGSHTEAGQKAQSLLNEIDAGGD